MTRKPKLHNVFLYILACVGAWSVAWLLTQALFIIDVPVISPWLERMDMTARFIWLTAFIVVIAVIATFGWHKWRGSYLFFKTKYPHVVIAAYVPLFVIAALIACKPDVFGVPGWLYALAIIVTSPIQDILTFGYLQTALAEHVKGWVAATITAVMFFLGHFTYDVSLMAGLFLGASFLFAALRLKTGSLYATAWVHLAFLLVTVL